MLPVDPTTLLAFIAAALVLVISPGPDTLLILRYTMASGQRVGLATVAGVQLGLIGHTAAAVIGLSLVIASAPVLFRMIAILGALYLVWLGVQNLRAGTTMLAAAGGPAIHGAKACRDAMLTNLLNPKVILLFLALMPNFVDLERGGAPAQLATLGVALILVNTVWQAGLALTAEGARRLLGRAGVQRAVARATGVVLLVFAALMLIEHAI